MPLDTETSAESEVDPQVEPDAKTTWNLVFVLSASPWQNHTLCFHPTLERGPFEFSDNSRFCHLVRSLVLGMHIILIRV
jgi:hypothetical protein